MNDLTERQAQFVYDEIGRVVKLKYRMTVSATNGEYVTCRWFDHGNLREATLPISSVKKIRTWKLRLWWEDLAQWLGLRNGSQGFCG